MGTPMTSPTPTPEASPLDPARRQRFIEAAALGLDRSYRLAGLLLGNGHDAEDAVQEALASAWRRFESLRDDERFAAWFDRILVNECRDRLRRRRTVRFVPIDGSIDPAGADPFRAMLERDALLRGLDRLTPDERVVVILRFWADLPIEAIAERLDWPSGTV
jgi:RNA polymerase sigma factor (sigma-70 family)